jgi:hypothetical protein
MFRFQDPRETQLRHVRRALEDAFPTRGLPAEWRELLDRIDDAAKARDKLPPTR